MAIMNMEAEQSPMAEEEMPMEEEMQSPMQAPMGMEEEDDDEYEEDIITNLEAHLNSLPDEAKAFMAEYITTPEVATVIGIINGPEVANYFQKYVDPSKKAVVQRVSPTQQPAQQGTAAQPQITPKEAPAPQNQGQQGIMQV